MEPRKISLRPRQTRTIISRKIPHRPPQSNSQKNSPRPRRPAQLSTKSQKNRKSAQNSPRILPVPRRIRPSRNNKSQSAATTPTKLRKNTQRSFIDNSLTSSTRSSTIWNCYTQSQLLDYIKQEIRSTNKIPHTTTQFYQPICKIGKGAFGKVYLAKQVLTNIPVAIKIIPKKNISDQHTRRKVFFQVSSMKKVYHKNVIRFLEVFENMNFLYIVMEYVSGGNLLTKLKREGRQNEQFSKKVFFDILSGLEGCHQSNIVHRDIKLDNILLDENGMAKICDFGVSKQVSKGSKISDQCGTPAYLAPQIVVGARYDPYLVDSWSLGVLLYTLLSGKVPFKGKNINDLNKIILQGEYEEPDYLSQTVLDLISHMLQLVPQQRYSIQQLKNHSWLQGLFDQKQYSRKVSNQTIQNMEKLGFPFHLTLESLKLNDINHAVATYFLLEVNKCKQLQMEEYIPNLGIQHSRTRRVNCIEEEHVEDKLNRTQSLKSPKRTIIEKGVMDTQYQQLVQDTFQRLKEMGRQTKELESILQGFRQTKAADVSDEEVAEEKPEMKKYGDISQLQESFQKKEAEELQQKIKMFQMENDGLKKKIEGIKEDEKTLGCASCNCSIF